MSHPTPLVADLALAVAMMAAGLGHTLEPWERDSLRSLFSFCANCGLAAVVTVDRGEPECQLGSCLIIPCPGSPVAPAWSTAHAKVA